MLLTSLLITNIACFCLSKRWQYTLDLICPLFGIAVCFICFPAWKEPLHEKPSILKIKTLIAISTFLFIINMVVGAFFSSNYIVSFAGRLLLWLNTFNIGLKLWGLDVYRVLYDHLLFTVIIEVTCYFINHQRVKLFLEKENSSKHEKQIHDIFQSIQTSVTVFNGDIEIQTSNIAAKAIENDVCTQVFD